jgi:hypothetical protein
VGGSKRPSLNTAWRLNTDEFFKRNKWKEIIHLFSLFNDIKYRCDCSDFHPVYGGIAYSTVIFRSIFFVWGVSNAALRKFRNLAEATNKHDFRVTSFLLTHIYTLLHTEVCICTCLHTYCSMWTRCYKQIYNSRYWVTASQTNMLPWKQVNSNRGPMFSVQSVLRCNQGS